MEREIIQMWLTDSETIVAIREYGGICSAVTVTKRPIFDEDIAVYHGHSWEEVFTVWFQDVIDDYYGCSGDIYEYFSVEQVQFMKDKYNMFNYEGGCENETL